MKKPKPKKPANRVRDFERALSKRVDSKERYVLRLYVTGSTARSAKAIQNLRGVCERHLHGRYDLEVIDIHQQPALASVQQIIAAPTLIKKLPEPIRKLVGDLSNEERVLMGLDLEQLGAHDDSDSGSKKSAARHGRDGNGQT